MRLNTTSQDWAYSIERLSHKVSAGFSFKAAEALYRIQLRALLLKQLKALLLT